VNLRPASGFAVDREVPAQMMSLTVMISSLMMMVMCPIFFGEHMRHGRRKKCCRRRAEYTNRLKWGTHKSIYSLCGSLSAWILVVRLRVRVCVRKYVCMYICVTYVYKYACMYACMHALMYAFIRSFAPHLSFLRVSVMLPRKAGGAEDRADGKKADAAGTKQAAAITRTPPTPRGPPQTINLSLSIGSRFAVAEICSFQNTTRIFLRRYILASNPA